MSTAQTTQEKKDTLELRKEMVDACISKIGNDGECLIRAIGGEFLITKIVQDESGIRMETPYDLDSIAERAKNGYTIGGSDIKIEFIPGNFGETDLETATYFDSDDKITKVYKEILYRYPRLLVEQRHIQIGVAINTAHHGSTLPILYDISGNPISNNAVNISWRESNAFDTLNMIDLSKYCNMGENPDPLYESFHKHQWLKREEVIKRCEENREREQEQKIEFIKKVMGDVKGIGKTKILKVVENYKKSLEQ